MFSLPKSSLGARKITRCISHISSDWYMCDIRFCISWPEKITSCMSQCNSRTSRPIRRFRKPTWIFGVVFIGQNNQAMWEKTFLGVWKVLTKGPTRTFFDCPNSSFGNHTFARNSHAGLGKDFTKIWPYPWCSRFVNWPKSSAWLFLRILFPIRPPHLDQFGTVGRLAISTQTVLKCVVLDGVTVRLTWRCYSASYLTVLIHSPSSRRF